jgi:hypothetical protein
MTAATAGMLVEIMCTQLAWVGGWLDESGGVDTGVIANHDGGHHCSHSMSIQEPRSTTVMTDCFIAGQVAQVCFTLLQRPSTAIRDTRGPKATIRQTYGSTLPQTVVQPNSRMAAQV